MSADTDNSDVEIVGSVDSSVENNSVETAPQNNPLAPQKSNNSPQPNVKRKRGRPPKSSTSTPVVNTPLQLTSSQQINLQSMTTEQHSRKLPVEKSIQVVQALVEGIGKGSYLIDITDRPGMPSYQTVMKWMAVDQDFHDTIKTAYKTWAISIMGINDRILRGDPGYSTGNFQRDDAIVKRNDRLISKMNIDWFGEKQTIEVTVREAVILDESIMGTIIDDGNDGV